MSTVLKFVGATVLFAASCCTGAVAQEPKEDQTAKVVVKVTGCVEKPGTYTLQGDSTITNAINAAGGSRDGLEGGAVLNRVQVVRGSEVLAVDVKKIRKHMICDFTLHDGDWVRVPEAIF